MKEIVEYGQCTGCAACVNICPFVAIRLEYNEKGCSYPIIDKSKCKDCGQCQKVCPSVNREENLGQEPTAYAYRIGKNRQLARSQSGGAFYSIAKAIIEDDGIVYGVVLDEKHSVTYQRATKLSQLEPMRKSKYVQAKVDHIYKQIEEELKNNRKVLFSGNACYTNGILSYLRNRNVLTDKLVTCDIVCHGVPGAKLFDDYWKKLEEKYGENITEFCFRDKTFGWHKNISSFHVDGRKMITSSWIRIFESQMCLRESCYSCQYANLHRVSDITIGDFWGIEEFMPSFSDNRGVSLILVSTEKGMQIAERLKESGTLKQVPVEKCMQPNLQEPTPKPDKWKEFWECAELQGIDSALDKYGDSGYPEDWEQIKRYQIIRRILRKVGR